MTRINLFWYSAHENDNMLTDSRADFLIKSTVPISHVYLPNTNQQSLSNAFFMRGLNWTSLLFYYSCLKLKIKLKIVINNKYEETPVGDKGNMKSATWRQTSFQRAIIWENMFNMQSMVYRPHAYFSRALSWHFMYPTTQHSYRPYDTAKTICVVFACMSICLITSHVYGSR